ncbi:MAG: DNA-directed RNA polymerase subunit RPC12/RpoP [Bacteroidia bacterium]|jgi:DNA-directed RNA polymerase subunit RPC12/RpoP
MTVKVVGKDDKYVKKVSCPKCASKLEYVLDDTYLQKYSCMGQSEVDTVIDCPVCSHKITV